MQNERSKECLFYIYLSTCCFKLHAYGFDMPSLKLVSSYSSNRKKRVKINDKFSSWEEIIFGVSHGPLLGSLLFNIFLCDLFLFTNNTDITNHAKLHPMLLKTQLIKLLNGWKNVLVICLPGLKITEWKLTQKNATLWLVRKKTSTIVTSDNLKSWYQLF